MRRLPEDWTRGRTQIPDSWSKPLTIALGERCKGVHASPSLERLLLRLLLFLFVKTLFIYF